MPGNYQVPSNLVSEFSPQDVTEFKNAFGVFDANGDGNIDSTELATVLTNLNETVTAAKLNELIDSVDVDGDHQVSFAEFCQLMHNVRTGHGGQEAMASIVTKAAKLFQISGAGGGSHTFSEDEKVAFTEHLNNCLADDPDVGGRLPLDPMSMDLFPAVQDGILLCKLINCAEEGTIDERVLTMNPTNKYQKIENANLLINAAKAIGCKVVNVGPTDIIEDGGEILILGLIWQIVKIQLLSSISLKNHPELVVLLEDGETLEDLLKLPPEQILLRWFNYHLAAAGHPKRINNFGSDIKDAEAYSVLLNQISPLTDFANESNTSERAAHVIRNAKVLDVPCFIKPGDITSGNKKLNLAFVAQIFNTCPALTATEEELMDLAGLLDDDVGDTREERVFRMWLNSLNLDDVYVNNLFADLQDGVILLKAMDKVQPGIVSWNKVNMAPRNKFKKVENCNYAVTLGKQMRFSLVGIGGVDIVNGNKMYILAIVWQLMRQHTLNVLMSLSGDGTVVTDDAIVAWANNTVSSAGKSSTMSSFRDPSLSNGAFLIDLLAGIEARIINWDLVTPGSTADDAEMNAKYAISVARALGACVFLTWEDITEVKSKMIMTFVASLWACSLTRH